MERLEPTYGYRRVASLGWGESGEHFLVALYVIHSCPSRGFKNKWWGSGGCVVGSDKRLIFVLNLHVALQSEEQVERSDSRVNASSQFSHVDS